MTYEAQIEALLQSENPEAILLEGFEEALIGHVNLWGGSSVAVYDTFEVIKILVARYKMSPEDATRYFQQNIDGKYLGPHTPLFLVRPTEPSEAMNPW